MPKDTYLRLSKEKQTHIETTAKQVFLKTPYPDVNITMIVKAAKIPRGSFYQYFTSLEDLYQHMFIKTLKAYESNHMAKLNQKEQKPNLHAWGLDSFISDYAFLSTSDHMMMLGKFFKERKTMNISLEFMKDRQEQFFKTLQGYIDLSALSNLSIDKTLKLMHWIQTIKFQKVHKILSGSESYKQAYQEYCFFIDVMYRGAVDLYA